MTKKRDIGEEIIEGLREVLAYARGEKHDLRIVAAREKPVNASSVRKKTGLTRAQFAAAFGVSARTLQDWEQGRRRPEGPARVLLTVIDKRPEAVLEALGVKRPRRRKAAVAARRGRGSTRGGKDKV